jgi:hypothetical protein
VAVSGQAGPAGQLITAGADVAALGGFSGRESEVSLAWLADAIGDGKISWVLTEGADTRLVQDSRTGARGVMAAVAEVGRPVEGVDGLYDVRESADALRALAR